MPEIVVRSSWVTGEGWVDNGAVHYLNRVYDGVKHGKTFCGKRVSWLTSRVMDSDKREVTCVACQRNVGNV